MDKSFVAINDWCHKQLRDLTRRTPLVVTSLDNGTERVHYDVRPELLPENYFSLVGCHTLDGLPLEQLRLGCWRVRHSCKPAILQAGAGFDSTRVDRRCWADLRSRPPGGSSALVSGELLIFGTGMLRGEAFSGRQGSICSKSQTVFARIWALRREGLPGLEKLHKRVYESTNLIYGDALGELEQLWDRRADTAFLDRLAQSLRDVRRWALPPASRNVPLNAAMVVKLHQRAQALWKVPPMSGRALLRRLEFILERTAVDNCVPAITQEPPSASPRTRRAPAHDWHRDNSGYDGWLPGNSAALN